MTGEWDRIVVVFVVGPNHCCTMFIGTSRNNGRNTSGQEWHHIGMDISKRSA